MKCTQDEKLWERLLRRGRVEPDYAGEGEEGDAGGEDAERVCGGGCGCGCVSGWLMSSVGLAEKEQDVVRVVVETRRGKIGAVNGIRLPYI